MLQAIAIGLVGVFGILDSRLLGRLNFERPLITCTIVGLIMGDLKTGLAVGAQMEMVTLGMMSIGASGIDMNMGAIVGCALVISTGADIETALAIATPMTLLANLIGPLGAIVRLHLTHKIDHDVEDGNYKAAKRTHIVYGPIVYAIWQFIPIFIAVYFGAGLINQILAVVPQFVMDGITLGANLISFFGFAMLLSTMVNSKNVIYFFLGFIICAYSGLGLTAVAVISIVAAVVVYQITYSRNGNGGSSTKSGKGDPLDDELEDALDDALDDPLED